MSHSFCKATITRLALAITLCLSPGLATFAQSATGTVRGTISDPSGALIPQAEITLSNPAGFSRKAKSNSSGSFELDRIVPGRYSLSVVAKGFSLSLDEIAVSSGNVTTHDVKLDISLNTEVQVTADSNSISVSPDDNANALVIKGKDLDALSDDPDDLSNELTALAGPSAGPDGAQIYIDGFTGGQLPPKSSIREIRINRNPFSAQYDKLGYGRIEILTKPGTDKFRGSLMINGNDSAFNSLNPFVKSEPSYHSTFFMGNVSVPISKSASWAGSVFNRNNASNSIVNAEILGANGTAQTYAFALPNPQSRLDISPRFDFQLGNSNTLTIRYMYDQQKQTNSGVSGFSLQSQAHNVSNHENTIQVSDTQILTPKIVNDLRFQYMADRNTETPSSTAPTVTVQGAFTAGGSNAGISSDRGDHYELQDYVNAAEGKHAINFGTRLRLTHQVNSSTAGFSGNYVYNTLAAYAAGTPSEYVVNAGKPSASVSLFDAALFYQDDWTVRPNLTLSYGLRYEGQNRISDHNDWAPRLSLAWAPGQRNGHKASTVFRAGYGWFYDRFSSSYILDAIHQNGINEQSFVIKNPSSASGFTCTPATTGQTTATCVAPSIAELSSNSSTAPSLYSVAPTMRAALSMEGAIGVDHQFGRNITLSATYINSRGVHQYLSENINPFIASTYDPATGTGIRPNGINENIYQFQSGGIYNQNQLMLNYTVRARRVSLFGFYTLGSAKSDTSGATYFSSNPNNPRADYARASFNVTNRFLLGGNIQAPFGISFSPMLVANSGTPFNITLGQDLNGDNQYNDRPAYATASSTEVMQTAFGNFDLSPAADAARIPYNIGTGPAQFSMNLRVAKSIGIGPKVEGGSNAGGGFGGPGGGPHGGHGGPGGGLGPAGLSGGGGPPRLDQSVPRKYSLTFTAMGRNVFNNVNLAPPVGVLNSQLFGKSTAIAGGFFGSSASNRSIELQAMFNF